MITYSQALEIIATAVGRLPALPVSLDAAAGSVSATAVTSLLDVPDFDNAAMDGYAVQVADIAAASEIGPVSLPLSGSIAAGDAPGARLHPGSALEIMTGAPVPDGCDAVVAVERGMLTGSDEARQVLLSVPAKTGQNIRRAGEDFRRGGILLESGTQLGPEHIMALAAGGIDQLQVRGRPRVCVLTTGAELASSGNPAGSGRIRDANGPYLRAALPLLGANLIHSGTAGDNVAGLVAAAEPLLDQADLLVTTGGVSAGRFDAVPEAVKALGGEILFHKVAIRPGKPILFARLPNGAYWFGLPGNPMAVAVGLRFFVAPALRAMQGLPAEHRRLARSLEPVRKRPGPRFFAKAMVAISAEGQLEVRVLPGQESFRILPLTQANCWAIIDEGTETLPAGELVEIASLLPGGLPATG